ncbi:AAA family ATPase [Streptomyces sp. N50]|uniref:AAA family ATPase n=1 Tax=Streptomyces sp. N50 TaxID=3081765 RepID=UPI0029621F71|nr:AAA family ATPase [Streptomyces sp. N50]WOX11428.1 AAA family ATPase [Streptomyces sp. N50]
MKISSIEILNFRPYGNEQTAQFSTLAGKNVTTLYGTNGGGKTTLLNAFTYVLYGKLSEDLEDKERLINSEAWSAAEIGQEVVMSVTLTFEHDGKTHRVTRRRAVTKRGPDQDAGREDFELRIEDGSGVWRKVNNPSNVIEKILPGRLVGFFFINGERIEYLAKQEAYSEIQSAIKTVLGIEPLERARRHLPSARNKIRHKLKSEEDGGIAIDKVNKEIDDFESEREEKREEHDLLRSEIGHLKADVESIDTRLRSLEGAAELQEARARCERLKEDADAALRDDLESRVRLVRQYGYLTFLPGLSDQIHVAGGVLRERGQLPAPLKQTFVEDLLSAAECICGTHLPEGSPQRAKIEEWLARAGLAEVEGAWAVLQGAMRTLEEQRKSAIEDLERLDKSIDQRRKTVHGLKGDLDEIAAKLKNVPEEDISRLEARRDERLQAIDEKTRRLGAVQLRLEELDTLLKQKSSLVEKLEVKNATNKRIQKRIAVLREAEEALEKTLELLSERTRRSLDNRIRRVFEKSSLKDYTPELTPDFELELWIGSGEERRRAPKSTGENMLLSLAFVAALAEECRSVAQNDAHAQMDMSDFPVVLDAAFGNLDVDYRRRVATFLPQMASQVIVLTSKAQAEGAAEEYLAPYVGKQYVITTHSRKADIEDVTETISVDGRAYPYQVVSASFDGAVLTEVQA